MIGRRRERIDLFFRLRQRRPRHRQGRRERDEKEDLRENNMVEKNRVRGDPDKMKVSGLTMLHHAVTRPSKNPIKSVIY